MQCDKIREDSRKKLSNSKDCNRGLKEDTDQEEMGFSD